MTNPISLSSPLAEAPLQSLASRTALDAQRQEPGNIGQRLEQMLWAEMLSHAGLEKAFTQAGGEAASAFSRYIVEAIAKDMAEKHPLGLSKDIVPTEASAQQSKAVETS